MARTPKPEAGATPATPDPVETDLELVTATMVAVITATVPRRRRAGRSFSSTPTRIPVDHLSEEDFDAIGADPLLRIHMEPAEGPADD